jgi:hypothetical protein
MPARIYVHAHLDESSVELGADAIVVFKRSDGAAVRVSIEDDEITVYNEDGRISVEPRSANAIILNPTRRAKSTPHDVCAPRSGGRASTSTRPKRQA